MTLATAVELRVSAAAVASGTGTAVDIAEATTLDLVLDVTAVTGTISVYIDTAPASTGPWVQVRPALDDDEADVFDVVSAVGAQWRTFPGCRRWVRVRWTLSAGGSATFAVTGSSVVVYATPDDMTRLGLTSEWITFQSWRAADAALRAATDEVDSALATYWFPELPVAELTSRLPLTSWGDDIREAACALAAETMVVSQGHRPNGDSDRVVYDRAERRRMWLGLVAEGRRKPAGMVARVAAEE